MDMNNSMFQNKILNYQHTEAKKKNDNSLNKITMFEDDFDEIL